MVATLHKLAALIFLLAAMPCFGGDMDTLLAQCAPSVHPTTMGAIIRTESGGNAYALSDDGPSILPWRVRKTMLRSFKPASLDEAVRITNELMALGHIVGLGLTQVNSRNLAALGLSVEEALNPCTNLNAGAKILTKFYVQAYRKYGDQRKALIAAISAYNTGDFVAGINNGYVGRVVNAGYTVPTLRAGRLIGVHGTKTTAYRGVTRTSSQHATARDILNEAKNSPVSIAFD